MDRREEGPILHLSSVGLGVIAGSFLTASLVIGDGTAVRALLFLAGAGILADSAVRMNGQYILSAVSAALIGFVVTVVLSMTSLLALYLALLGIIAGIVYVYRFVQRNGWQPEQ